MRVTLLPLLLTLAACEPAAGGRPGAAERPESQPTVLEADDQVVAMVDGVPITASRVARLCEATGRPPREVVERLVDFEILAAEARRRGFARDREARAAARKAMVQRYLEEEFEASHRPEDMSESALKEAYERNRSRFVRPRMMKVAHILVVARRKTASPTDRAEARRLGREIYREARKAKTMDEFAEVGHRHREAHRLEVRLERLKTPVSPRARLDPDFITGALALKRPGEISPPVESDFGTHIIYLDEVREAINRPYEEVREEIASNEHPFWQKAAFFRMVEDLRLASKVEGWSGAPRRDKAP